MVSFEIKKGEAAAHNFLRKTQLFALAESLGGVASLAEYPALMSHASMSAEARKQCGISEGLVRLSVGIEDVQDIMAAGIHVITTMNVQHLESLNDQVFQMTGVRVRETVPDSVFEQADEVELVDLAPDDLETPPLSLGQLAWRRFRRTWPKSFRKIPILNPMEETWAGFREVLKARKSKQQHLV